MYYSVFQNIRNTLQELYLLSVPAKKHKNVFPNVPIEGFHNSKP